MHGDKLLLCIYSEDKCTGKHETSYSGLPYLAKFADPSTSGKGVNLTHNVSGTKKISDENFLVDFFICHRQRLKKSQLYQKNLPS